MSNQLERTCHMPSRSFLPVLHDRRNYVGDRVEASSPEGGGEKKNEREAVGRPIESRELHDPLCSITLHPRIRIQGLLLGVLKFTTVSESRGCEKCMARCTTIGMPRVAFPSPHVTDTTRYNSPSYYL